MKMPSLCLLVASVCAGLISTNCTQPNKSALRDSLLLSTENLKAYYNLNDPENKYFLPYYLAEISGLAFKSPDTLLAIQDEEGILYEFDVASGKVVHSTKFGSRHDFEDVALIGDSVFVLESNGKIRMFRVSDLYSGKKDVQTFDTGLSIRNDAEGLCYDPKSHSLLIACKASGEVNKNKTDGKSVYRFDVATGELNINPFFNVTKKDLERYFEQHKGHDYEADRFHFEPSAVAFNPADHLYYLLASVGKLMIVFDDQGVIHATYPIPAALLVQPEGLCFSPEGDMYISSEGEDDKGYILKYPMKRR